MNKTFADAVRDTPVHTSTTNGMAAFTSTCKYNVDLFGDIGSSRGKDVTALFEQALHEDAELAVRIALWTRDVRSGAGERQIFRDILLHLESNHRAYLVNTNLLSKIPELGRFDDLLVFNSDEVKSIAFSIIREALNDGNGLCAKWMPRKGPVAVELRNFLGLTPKAYRKTLVNMTNVVETQMCNKEFEAINFSHVPSLAMSRYTKAFAKRAPEQFTKFKEDLQKGDPKIAKVNAGAVYPYDVIKTLVYGDKVVADAQWEALPNFIGDANILPLVDVSGSMYTAAGTNSNVSCLDVAVSLGLYCASKNTGKFKDLFLTFSSDPEFVTLRGSLSARYETMSQSNWQMSTNLELALKAILDMAVKNNVPQEEMPSALLIMSDMQFDSCVSTGKAKDDMYGYMSYISYMSEAANPRAIEMIKSEYISKGYNPPAVVFWNLNSRDNKPVKFNETGTALISGFSPSIMKAVLSADINNMTPEGIMRRAIMIDRYDFR